jgi:uncharacterized protein YaaW (UPF0174 family)
MALSDIMQSLLGQQAEAAQPATPTPDMTKFMAGLMAPQDTTPSPLMKAQERPKSLSNPQITAKPKKKTPLQTKKEEKPSDVKPAAEAPVEIAKPVLDPTTLAATDSVSRLNEMRKKFAELTAIGSPGESLTQKQFTNLVPNDVDFNRAVNQGLNMEAAAMPEDVLNTEQNRYVQDTAKKLLEEKMASPYRNVDLERMDKLSAALMGAKALGMKNEPSPQEELMSLAKMNQLKQAYDQFKAKEVGDYTTRILTPYNVGGATYTVPQPPAPRTGGKPKEVRGPEITKAAEAGRKALETQGYVQQMAELLKKPWSYENSSKYDTLVNNVVNRVKELEKYGANFSGIEQTLSRANMPASYNLAKIQGSAGMFNKAATLEAFGQSLGEKGVQERKNLDLVYTRPGEPQFVNQVFEGTKSVSQAGKIVKEVPKNIKDILDKVKGGKK